MIDGCMTRRILNDAILSDDVTLSAMIEEVCRADDRTVDALSDVGRTATVLDACSRSIIFTRKYIDLSVARNNLFVVSPTVAGTTIRFVLLSYLLSRNHIGLSSSIMYSRARRRNFNSTFFVIDLCTITWLSLLDVIHCRFMQPSDDARRRVIANHIAQCGLALLQTTRPHRPIVSRLTTELDEEKLIRAAAARRIWTFTFFSATITATAALVCVRMPKIIFDRTVLA